MFLCFVCFNQKTTTACRVSLDSLVSAPHLIESSSLAEFRLEVFCLRVFHLVLDH